MKLAEQGLRDELDELMEESLSKGTTKTKLNKASGTKIPVFIDDDLDALLIESLEIRDEAQATKNLREKLKRGKVTSAERLEIEAKVREWESRNVWDTVANVAVFERVTCECGFYSEAFSHMMLRQTHKHTPNTTRLIVSDTMVAGLPQKVARQVSDVTICGECAESKGWDMAEIEELTWQA